MSTVPAPLKRPWDNGYPTWSAEPMPETDLHRELMVQLIEMLRRYYEGQQVYVTGNILVFYQPGDRRRHVSPDVWLARGVESVLRPNYLIWEEARGPEFVIELTSDTTQRVDQTTKLALYRDTLRVREYFLFDPYGEYLDPRLQGYRLRGAAYQRIRPRHGRLPSQVTGLHLEAAGEQLRLWDPATLAWLPTPAEFLGQTQGQLEQTQGQLEQTQEQLQQAQQQIEAMQRELALLRGEQHPPPQQ
jgi:Uma2 family endonuclease